MARIVDPAAHQKKGGKGQKSARKEAVNQLFRDAGVDPNKVNKCLKAGVLNGHVPLTEEGTINLDQVLLKSGCNCCSKELTCTIRDALYQIEYGGNEYEDGGEHAAVHATMKRSLMVMVAVGTSSLASAMGISTSTLASSITIVGNAPTSVTALEITARDATANQAAVEKAALVESAFLDR